LSRFERFEPLYTTTRLSGGVGEARAFLDRPADGPGGVDLAEGDQMVHVELGRAARHTASEGIHPESGVDLSVIPEVDGNLAVPDQDLLAVVPPVPVQIHPVRIVGSVVSMSRALEAENSRGNQNLREVLPIRHLVALLRS
jgi:hypothetical protein